MEEVIYLQMVADAFEPLNQCIEEIEEYLKLKCKPIGGINLKLEKPSETPPKELVEKAYREAAEVFFRLDIDEMRRMSAESKVVKDNLSVTITDLMLALIDLTDRFKPKVADGDIIIETTAAVSHFATAMRDALEDSGEYRISKAKEAADRMLRCAARLVGQSYFDEAVPPAEYPPLTDLAMQFPPPDESELHGCMPSSSDGMGLPEVKWFRHDVECGCLFAADSQYGSKLYVNECINRLWGKSLRLRNDITLDIKQIVQMPRLVMYPFYAAFFDMAYKLYDAAKQYKSGELKPVRGSLALKNPMDGGNRLFMRMKDVLRFAPREYFEQGRQHEVYLRLCGHVFSAAMDAIRASLPKDAMLQCTGQIEKAKTHFGNFILRLESPAYGTVRMYVADSEKLVKDFKAEIYSIAAILVCVENQIEDAKETIQHKAGAENADMSTELKKIHSELRANRAIGNDILYTVSGGDKGVEQPQKSRAGQVRRDMAVEGLELIKKAKLGTLTSTEAARKVINDSRYSKRGDGYKNVPADIDALRKQIDRLAEAEGLRT